MNRGGKGALLVALCVASRATAQAPAGSFIGIVTRDTLGSPVADANLLLSGINRAARSGSDGSFKITSVPAGHYHLVVRAIGFEVFQSDVDIAAGQVLNGEIQLTRAPILLDTVTSRAARRSDAPYELQEFEFRRRSSPTGYFITDSLLRKREDGTLGTLFGAFPGAKIVLVGGRELLAASHGPASQKPVFQSPSAGGPCLATVYLDGREIYPAGGDAPDFGRLKNSDFSAAEFYPDPTEAPLRFQRTGSGCAIALLWSRVRK